MRNYKEELTKWLNDLNYVKTDEEVKIHNRAMTKIGKLFKEITLLEDKSFLLDLLYIDKKRAQVHVAARCIWLGVYVEEAIQILESYKNDDNWQISLTSKTLLERYEKQGYLTFND
jgi:hypothetical protein